MITLVACLLYTTTSFSAVETHSVSIHFDTDRDELSSAAQVMLRSFFEQFSPHDDLRISVSGHADLRGSDAYNMALAERRCQSVKQFIDALRLEPTSLQVDTYGERSPLAAGMSDRALAMNRRVEVIVERVHFDSMEAFLSESSQEYQHAFLIESDEPQTLSCKNGSSISIPANALLNADGSPYVGQARVEIIEALDPTSFFFNKLSTVSGDDVLVSGGMLQILAFSEQDEPLTFDETQSMVATIPSDQPDSRMTLFVSENGANWDNTGRATNLSLPNRGAVIDYTLPDSCNCPGMKPVRRSLNYMREPLRPAVPIRPEEPRRTIVDTETTHFRWWQRRQIRLDLERLERAQEAQDRAYERRLERYKRQLNRFYTDSVSYPDRLNDWYLASAAFDREVDSIYCYFVEVTLHESIVKHKEAHEPCYERRERCIETMRANAESLRQVLDEQNATPMQDYTTELNGFGWCNIDRFMYGGQKPESIDLEIPKPDKEIYPFTVLVYKNERGLIQMGYNLNNEKYRAYVPKSVAADIVSCYVHNDRLYTASAPFQGKPNMTLEYEPSTPEAFRELMQSFNTMADTAER